MRHLGPVLAIVLGVGCKDNGASSTAQGSAPPGVPPPNVASARSSTSAPSADTSLCAPGDVGFADAAIAAVLPAQVGRFCALKSRAPQSFGAGTPKKIEDVTDLIDGAGDTYTRNYFARRYDSVKYVDGSGSGAEVEIALSTFDKPENAYALFTYRVVANVDPDPEAAKKVGRRGFRAIPGAGAAVLGNASAIMWKGTWLGELSFNPDPKMTEQEAAQAADQILPQFVAAIGSKVVGAVEPPADVRALPTAKAIALGIEYVPVKYTRPEGKVEALKLPALGSYAVGYYKDGVQRWRVLAFVREEREAAREVMEAFRKMTPSSTLKDKDSFDDAVHFAFEVGAGGASAAGKAEGVAARKGTVVYAIIDEEHALGTASDKPEVYPRVTKEEKIAKLKDAFAQPKGPAASPSAATSSSVTHP